MLPDRGSRILPGRMHGVLLAKAHPIMHCIRLVRMDRVWLLDAQPEVQHAARSSVTIAAGCMPLHN